MANPLADALRAETEETIKRIRQEAADEAKNILCDAKQEASSLRKSVIEHHEQQAQREAKRIIREAQQQAAQREAETYDRLTDLLIERLHEALHVYPKDEQAAYQNALNVMLNEARAAAQAALAEDEPTKVRVVERDIDLLSEQPNETMEGLGGVVITSEDGAIRFDNSLESRIELARPHLRKLLRNAEL